ncbi:MAG: TetR/AcrR family transcriptional regulator [Eubacteriales bacterium]|nr:TetR/AcrR family transcriptional regulator [Eubacteriales bacterium]
MPKIIENLQAEILLQAKDLLFTEGYTAMTMRAVAARCHVAIGTLYNYYPSKDMLIGNVVLGDWKATVWKIRAGITGTEDLSSGLAMIYGYILAFNDLYRELFRACASVGVGADFENRHVLLRRQVEELLGQLFQQFNHISSPMAVRAAAQLFLTGSAERWEFASMRDVIEKII